ncbi:MAG: hypothetical protein ACXWT3_07030 [Methylococcaceae bacterium]
MKIQTKCTLVIVSLFIIEIMPVPLSALYSLYAIRKRPDWLPRVVDKLYADKQVNIELTSAGLYDPMALRRKCTINLAIMFVIDLIVPVIIPTALYVVRRRPVWFQNLVVKLYADKLTDTAPTLDETPDLINEDPEFLTKLQHKLAELDDKNLEFAKSLSIKMRYQKSV